MNAPDDAVQSASVGTRVNRHNEEIRFSATLLGNSAVASITVGVFAPIAAYIMDTGKTGMAPPSADIVGCVALYAVLALILYDQARRMPGNIL